MNKIKKKYIYVPIITAVLSLVMLLILNFTSSAYKYKSYSEFISDLSINKVSTVYITASPKITVKLKDGTQYESDNPRADNFKEDLLRKNVQVLEQGPANFREIVPIIFLITSLAAIGVMAFKNSNISSRKMNSVDAMDASAMENVKYNFSSVAGNEEAKESVKDIVDFLSNPEKYTSYGARMPKGIILYGEPGTGKTLLAKAVAGEAGVPFYAVTGSDFVQVYVGVGASRIRQLFKKAKSHGKAVIFIDEIDAIGKKRDASRTGGSDERDQTLNALLTEMSGFNEKEGIVVIAATNRLDMLDSALLRPGRFDRHIEIMLPDIDAREKILSLHLKNKPAEKICIKDWAHKTAYFSGAKIESFVNEAAILACKENSKFIEEKHMDTAFSIILAGYEKKNRNYIKDADRDITAFHEAGHALISMKVLPGEKVSKVTIIPSTKGAGGYTLSIPESRMYQHKEYLKNRIMVLLGGRASEEIMFGSEHITTGAHNDLKQSTKIALSMVAEYGMGNSLGLLNINELTNLNMNEDKIVDECKNLVDKLYEDTKCILLNEKDKLINISNKLIEKETLYSEELKKMVLS